MEGGLRPRRGGLLCAALLLACQTATSEAQPSDDDRQRQILDLSQAALGRQVSDMAFTDSRGQPRRLSDYAGRPVAISLVFTACAQSCSVTTRHLDRVVREARAALGQKSFTVLTIGFDTPADTPEAMRDFARRNGVNDPDWYFLSSDDAAAMGLLMRELGMVSEPSVRGFDHTVQISLLDRNGVLYRQVYGETFSKPLLVEPLKDLVLGRPASDDGVLTRIGNRVRLFCTVYDPRADRYFFDYSLFAAVLIGVMFFGVMSIWTVREVLYARRKGRT